MWVIHILQMEELAPTADSLKPQIQMVISISEKVLHSESIREFFAYILTLGNFINMVSCIALVLSTSALFYYYYYSYRQSYDISI